nr:hypothetical protein [Providencia rettgeri]
MKDVKKQKQLKQRTLKQLEDRLKYLESFIQQCVDAVSGELSLAFKINDKSVSYEDIQKLPLNERYSFANQLIESNEDFNDTQIQLAIRTLYILGFRELAQTVHILDIDYGITQYYQPEIDEIKAEIKRKKITSKGGKNRANPHKEEGLKIAADTWKETPNASRASLAKKIRAYLNEKYIGIPENEAVEKWLKNSGLDPKISPNISGEKYDLVIKK